MVSQLRLSIGEIVHNLDTNKKSELWNELKQTMSQVDESLVINE
jgi:hypothetical protein